MPTRDRTGPMGLGPMTGRGAGFCADYDVPGFRALGRGRGWRNRFYATGLPRWARSAPQVTVEEETQALEDQAQWLNEQLEAIQGRLAELKE